jgi:hypothetical protein
MTITITKHGNTLFDGPDAVNVFRLITLLSALRLEVRTNGRVQATRGPKAHTIIKREFGLKGTREQVYVEFERIVDAAKASVPVVRE